MLCEIVYTISIYSGSQQEQDYDQGDHDFLSAAHDIFSFLFINSNRPAKSYAGQFYYHIIYPESKYDYSLLAFLCIFQ